MAVIAMITPAGRQLVVGDFGYEWLVELQKP
jgi:hypothetical protein